MKKYILLLILSLGCAKSVLAQETLQQFGVIDWFEVGQTKIVVDDWEYGLAINLKLNGVDGKPAKRIELKQGKKIRFLVLDLGRTQEITEINLLRDSANRPVER